MSEQPRTRQELYERIRQTSREEFILDQMIRLGFWPARGEMPHDPADEIRRRGELTRQINELRAEHRRLGNEEAQLKELRKRRLAESRRKQQETKERRERERQESAARWQLRKENEIIYLGSQVSAGLNEKSCDEERLNGYGLPRFDGPADIAKAIGISIGRLRFLAFDRKTATQSHYVHFKITKKTGGERLINAPKPKLKAAQHWILRNILERVEAHHAAHGFRAGRSILSNAVPHAGAGVVVNFDFKDFFPTITYRRVKGVFRSLGYSESAATIFALLCTAPDTEEVEIDGSTYFVALGERHLPQGAPTSPALTNILCRRLDRRLERMSSDLGFAYTRYADDLTFSASNEESQRNLYRLMRRVESIVAHEGLSVNAEKTRVLRRSRRQEVTGLVVNHKPAVDRQTLRRFRATLFQIERNGLEGKRWGQSGDLIASLQGFANFVLMVDRERGIEFKRRVKAISDKHNWQPPKRERQTSKKESSVPPTGSVTHADAESESREPAPKKWWKLW